MDLTPSAIRRKTFQLVRRGFDPQEVGAFLERLAEHMSTQHQATSAAETNLARMEAELREARSAEEAVRLTMVAATQAKEEILATANSEATAMRQSARDESEQLLERAEREAYQLLDQARREATALRDESIAESEQRVVGAKREQAALQAQIEHLREVVGRVRHTLGRLAEGALSELDHAEVLLGDIPQSPLDRAPATDQRLAGSSDPDAGRHLAVPVGGDEGYERHDAPEGKPDGLDPDRGRHGRPSLEVLSGDDASTGIDIVAEIEPLLDDDGVDGPGSVVHLPDAVDRLLSQLRDING